MTIKISGVIGTTNGAAELGAEVWVDQNLLFSIAHVKQDTDFSFDIDDDDTMHCLRFVLKNKTPEHTQLDQQGNIVQDARLVIKDVAFDEIMLGQTLIEQAVYTHNFNSTQSEAQERFYGEMGCNGTVSLKFSCPVYIWLLENQ